MRQVIFVGSTSYSGSTFFDMILGNDPAGFSCGEVYAYFHPFRPHHMLPACGCGDLACDLWPQVKSDGEEHIYESIFNRHPEVNFIVDSSKDPFWIERQSRILSAQGIRARNILIWKTPVDLAYSYKKRNMPDAWERSWIVYHRLYYSLIDEWRAVRYDDFAQNPEALPAICAYLDIPYFPGKEKFWQKKHHLLFGNASARVHLQETSSASELKAAGLPEMQRQEIYYQPVTYPDLIAAVQEREASSKYIRQLTKLLAARDIFNEQAAIALEEMPGLQMNAWDIAWRKARQSLVYAVGRWRYAR